MRLRLAIALLAIAVLAGGCAATRAEKQALGAAYSDLLMEGDTARARERLEPIRDIYDKLFLMACAELTDGNLDKAKSYAERMVEMKPKVPDGKVLLGLVNRRIAYPEESWVESFATAWKEAGKPELTITDIIYEWDDSDESNEKYYEAYETAKGTPDELLMAFPMGLMNSSAESIELALKYSKPDAPFEIRLLALSEIPPLQYMESKLEDEEPKLSPKLIEKAKTRRHEILRQLAEEFPELMIYELAILIEDTRAREVFNSSDIARLEEISNKKKFSHTMNELYDLSYARFKELGFNKPQWEAFQATLTLTTYDIFNIRGKVIETAAGAPDDIRFRLADILDNIGKVQLKQGATIYFLIGRAYIRVAKYVRVCRGNVYTCAQEEPETVEALSQDKEDDAFNSVYDAVFGTITRNVAPILWPIRPLNTEAIELQVHNEVKYILLLADEPMPEELKKYLE